MKTLKIAILAPLKRASIIVAFACLSQVAKAQFAPQVLPADFMQQHYIGEVVGRVDFQDREGSYIGSATAIKPRSILTCGHNLYDKRGGWSRRFVFKRSYYQGTPFGANNALRKIVLAGYVKAVRTDTAPEGQSSPDTFALDLGGVILKRLAANGVYARWQANPSLLTTGAAKFIFGYGSEEQRAGIDGERLLYSATYRAYEFRRGMWMGNSGMGSHGGMSGGPIYVDIGGNNLQIAGVHVSGGSDYTRGAGCRAIDDQAARLIERNLR